MTNPTEADGPWRRAAALAVLVVALGGMLVWAGTLSPVATPRDYPGEDSVGPDPDAYVGEHVTLSGTVVGTDPLRIEVPYGTGESFTATVRGVEQPASVGDHATAFGTLEDDSTLAAERVILRAPWEIRYMYGVSFVAGLWVLGRTLRRWRFDTDRLAFVPREEPLALWGGGDA
jgi:hypothetical protein